MALCIQIGQPSLRSLVHAFDLALLTNRSIAYEVR